jgi:hypothetical protein
MDSKGTAAKRLLRARVRLLAPDKIVLSADFLMVRQKSSGWLGINRRCPGRRCRIWALPVPRLSPRLTRIVLRFEAL